MLPKINRLPLRSLPDFFQTSKVIKQPLFSVYFRLNQANPAENEKRNWRAAVIVSKKVSLRATDRNLLKRRFLAALQTLTHRLSPVELVVVVHSPAARHTYPELLTALESGQTS